jgi:hypothetical protein
MKFEKQKYICKYIDHDLEIGNNFDKKEWKLANPINKFYIPVSLEEPISKTEAGLLWSDNYLYCFFKAYDKDIFAVETRHDELTYLDDVCELFFSTNPDKEPYYNFEINALNTVYDAYSLKLESGGGGSRRWSRWVCKGLKSAVNIKGEINNPEVIDEYWQLEIAVPFSSLEIPGKKAPEAGDKWEFHVSRYDYSIHLPGEGYQNMSSGKLTKAQFHNSCDWDYLIFEK